MACATVIALLITVISLIYFWIRKRYSFFEDNGFLYEKPTFPFGNLKGVGRDFHISTRLKEYYDKFKGKAPCFGMYFFINSQIVITDLDMIKNVMVKDFDAFHNRGLFHNERDDPLTGHLFLIEDAAWKNMRAKLTPTFTSGKMKMMFNTVLGISDIMIAQLKTEPNLEMIEVKEVLAKFTTDVIGNVAFGLEMNSIGDPDSMFRKMGKKIFNQGVNIQLKIFLLSNFRHLAKRLRFKFLPAEISDFFLNSIRETVNYRTKNNIERNDVMDLLLKIRDNQEGDDDGKLTLNQLAAQCFIFFVAGFETSSSTSTFILYFLAIHQNIQDKLRLEIKNVLAKYDGEITYDGMQEMKYLQMVIDETLRIYGPVPQLLRRASYDYKMPNTDYTIPKETLIIIPIYAIHMDPDIYPEPEKFDPERFSDENKRNRHPMAFLAFGEGPRNCIGERFGLMQTKIAIIKMLMNFKITTTTRTPIPMVIDVKSLILAPPNNSMWLKLNKLD